MSHYQPAYLDILSLKQNRLHPWSFYPREILIIGNSKRSHRLVLLDRYVGLYTNTMEIKMN